MTLVVAPTGETRINTTTSNNQDQPVIASLSDGGWVVTWRSESQDGSGTGIYQQRYAANGLAIGGEILVNRTTANNQTVPKVTGLSDGGWLVVWESPDGAGSGIYQQRYNQYGLKVGPETRVNTTTANNQQEPTVTALVGGGWVVTWASEFQDGSGFGVYQQRYGANGYPIGTEKLVNTVTLDTQWKPSVTALADGGWIVTWEQLGTIANRFDIKQQRYDADGWTVDDETRVNIPIEGDQVSSRVTALKDGGWVVTWTSFGQDGSDNGIYLQRYAVNGQKVGGEILVNTTTAGNQSASFVTALADGGWVVTWTSGSTGDATADVYQQRFAANGAKIQGERLVNTFTAGNQIATSVTALKDGSWIVAWQSMDQDGAGWGTYQQRFTAAGQAVGPTTPTGLSLSGNAVNECAAAATQIGQLVVQSYVTDPGLTYSLLDSAGGRFSLSSKGVLSVKDGVRLDYEQAASHSILVEVKDSWGSSYKTWLSVSVRDVASERVSGSSGSDLLKGGSGRDAFKGGAGNDTLWGGLGNDTLQGDAGRDAFVFDTKPNGSSNKDKIADFKVKDDAIWLDNKVFTKLGKAGSETKPAQLKKDFFTVGAKAKDKNDYLVYDKAKGFLYYDADGSGKGKAVEVATLSKNLNMTYKDFFII